MGLSVQILLFINYNNLRWILVCCIFDMWDRYKQYKQTNINHMKALNFIIELLMIIAIVAIIIAGVCFFVNTMLAVYCFLAALGFSFLFAILSVFED